MAGVRNQRRSSGKFQGWFTDHTGERKWFDGTRSRAETLRIAQRLEDEHRQIRLGYIPLKNCSPRAFAEARDEYIAWGMTQGGRGGRPWGRDHTRKRRERLTWWGNRLALQMVADLQDSLAQVEAILRELSADGRAGKTLANYAEALAAFCDWCVARGYLEADPLKDFKGFDTTPKDKRRAMTVEEIQRLLVACPSDRRLLWETALLSGLRANELRHLSVDHLDVAQSGLHLDASWTKNRKGEYLPLPHALVERLRASTNQALARYGQVYKKERPRNIPSHPLLYVPRDLARVLDKDLQLADIPKYTKAGKVDFHALRVTYINLVIESGVNLKEAQTLARHATPDMTMNVYGRTKEERLSFAVEQIAERVTSVSYPDPGKGKDESESFIFNDIEKQTCTECGGSNPPFGI
jgi:integrase